MALSESLKRACAPRNPFELADEPFRPNPGEQRIIDRHWEESLKKNPGLRNGAVLNLKKDASGNPIKEKGRLQLQKSDYKTQLAYRQRPQGLTSPGITSLGFTAPVRLKGGVWVAGLRRVDASANQGVVQCLNATLTQDVAAGGAKGYESRIKETAEGKLGVPQDKVHVIRTGYDPIFNSKNSNISDLPALAFVNMTEDEVKEAFDKIPVEKRQFQELVFSDSADMRKAAAREGHELAPNFGQFSDFASRRPISDKARILASRLYDHMMPKLRNGYQAARDFAGAQASGLSAGS